MNAVAERPNESVGDVIEKTLLEGDLSRLTPEQRVTYYHRVCDSLGLNPLTKPFDYLKLNGKLQLYARKDCTDQLRKIHGVSVIDLTEAERADVFIVTAKVEDKDGRRDAAKGAVTIKGLVGDALANAIMKAETKAKRRATLSICGLGMLDELEVETIPGSRVTVQPEPEPEKPAPAQAPKQEPKPAEPNLPTAFEMYADKLRAAQTIDALKVTWDGIVGDKTLTKGERTRLNGVKDERKAALSQPVPTPEEMKYERTKEEALAAMKAAGLTWPQVIPSARSLIGRELGRKAMPTDLTLEELDALCASCKRLKVG